MTGISQEVGRVLDALGVSRAAWADGSMDGIKASNASKASLRQLGETVTRMLYPVLEKLLPIVQRVADWLGERLPGALRTAGGAAIALPARSAGGA